jgi:hypothetical protein
MKMMGKKKDGTVLGVLGILGDVRQLVACKEKSNAVS